MRRFLRHVGHSIARLLGRKPRPEGLTAIEYEAVCLIAYEGRAAYARACEQALYCQGMGSEAGFRFWSEVAAEVKERVGRSVARQSQDRPG